MEITTQAWLYPDKEGSDACNAEQEYSDGRAIDILKPQYFTLKDDGTLYLNTVANSGCNGYSVENAASIKQHSTQQFVTVSGNPPGDAALTSNRHLKSMFMTTIIAFLGANQFTGVEIDFETFSKWSSVNYQNYLSFIQSLGNALHAHGYKLMIDGPAISDPTYQGYYPQWRWSDFEKLPVDFLVVMAYDAQYDNGAGTPIAALSWIQDICSWMKGNITDSTRIVIGINSYGYMGKTGGYADTITRGTYNQLRLSPGYSTATRDKTSGEILWQKDTMSYDYSDSITLDMKRKVIVDQGIFNLSVFHLGGNQWFSSLPPEPAPPEPTPTPVVTPTQPLTLSPEQIYNFLTILDTALPGLLDWYHAHFTPSQEETPTQS